MKRELMMFLTLAELLAAAGQSQADLYTGTPPTGGPFGDSGTDPQYSISYRDSYGNKATISLSTIVIGNGIVVATSGTLDITSGSAQGTYSLITGHEAFVSPNQAFRADNAVYTNNKNSPILDNCGLLFGSKDGKTEVNF